MRFSRRVLSFGLLFTLFSNVHAGAPTTKQATPDPTPCHIVSRQCTQNEGCSEVLQRVGNCQNQNCKSIALCLEGYQWDDQLCKCTSTAPQGVSCGNTVCGQGQYCCNKSCGICAPLGGFCTQQFCG